MVILSFYQSLQIQHVKSKRFLELQESEYNVGKICLPPFLRRISHFDNDP